MSKIVWQLPELLSSNGLKARQVEDEAIRLGYKFGRNSIYRLNAGNGPTRYDQGSLVAILASLRSLTKHAYDVCDLLKYTE